LLGASVVALVGFVLSSEAAHAALLRALDNVQQTAAARPRLAAALVVLFTGVAAMLAFVSSWLVIPFAVHTWGTSSALLLVWAGWLLGGAASYVIGRFLGAPVVRWLGFSRLLARYEERVSHRTPFTLALLFQLALPSELRGYLFGLGRYPFGRYMLSLALAELPFGIASVYLGAGIVQRRATLVLAMGLALVLMSASSLYLMHRRLTGPRDVLEREVVPAARPPSA
jgi:uncharacterized membrane protein YdjX (TVP38/TMEM64 family)